MVDRPLALFLRTSSNDYQESLREDCLAAARRHGFKLQWFSADDDAARQVRQIHEAVTGPRGSRPVAVLVSPVRESALLTVAHEATRAGIGWVFLNRWNDSLLALRDEFPALPIFAVNPDQHQVGSIQGRQFRALMPDGGELLYIQGPLGTSSAHRRFSGMQDAIAGIPMRVVTFNSDWSIGGGEAATNEWLRIFAGGPLPPHCIVGAQNDVMAMGARNALLNGTNDLQRAFASRVPVTGCDGSPSYGQRLVLDGELAATVVIPPVAGRAVDEIASMLASGRPPPAEIVVKVSSYPDLPTMNRARTGSRP